MEHAAIRLATLSGLLLVGAVSVDDGPRQHRVQSQNILDDLNLSAVASAFIDSFVPTANANLTGLIPDSIDLANVTNQTIGVSDVQSACIIPGVLDAACICETMSEYHVTINTIGGLDTLTLEANSTVDASLTLLNVELPWTAHVVIDGDAGASVAACGISLGPSGTFSEPLDLTGSAAVGVNIDWSASPVCVTLGSIELTVTGITFGDLSVVIGSDISLAGLLQNFDWQALLGRSESQILEAANGALANVTQALVDVVNVQSDCAGRAAAKL